MKRTKKTKQQRKVHFWWTLRRHWHMSNVYAECCWPPYSSHYFMHWDKACIKHLIKRNLLWHDFKVFWKRAYRGFRVIQPFGCKSHWRRSSKEGKFGRTWFRPQWWYEFTIDTCEYLEGKARQAEGDKDWACTNPFKTIFKTWRKKI